MNGILRWNFFYILKAAIERVVFLNMTKLNSNVDPKLSDVVIQQLERRNITTVIEFIDEDLDKLVTFTGLLLKVNTFRLF